MEIKFAHTSDLHIGAKCRGIGAKGEIRRHEILNTFFNIMRMCTENNIDILFIAGDLFDDVGAVSEQDIKSLKRALSMGNFEVVISPGNHDPFTPDSPYNSVWPDNVWIFKNDKLEFIEFPDLKLRVWGHAFKGAYEKKHLLQGIRVPNDDFMNIGVMHGSLSNFDNSVYFPIFPSEVQTSDLNYLALGHIHKRSELNLIGNTYYAYCGCPEATGFDETGEKGFYIGRMSDNYLKLEFKPCSKRNYEILKVDVTNLESDFEIYNLILEKIKENYKEKYMNNIYRIILTGEISEYYFINTSKIETYLSDFVFFISVLDNTETKIDIKNLEFRNDFKSVFIKKMMLKIDNSADDCEKLINKEALKIGLKAFSEEVKYNDN